MSFTGDISINIKRFWRMMKHQYSGVKRFWRRCHRTRTKRSVTIKEEPFFVNMPQNNDHTECYDYRERIFGEDATEYGQKGV